VHPWIWFVSFKSLLQEVIELKWSSHGRAAFFLHALPAESEISSENGVGRRVGVQARIASAVRVMLLLETCKIA